jgi:hypothetical protein
LMVQTRLLVKCLGERQERVIHHAITTLRCCRKITFPN